MKRFSLNSLGISLGALALALIAGCPYVEYPTATYATISTSLGTIEVALDTENAPLSVANFRQYAEADFYDGTIFHRVIADFVIQGGGYTPDLVRKDTEDPIINEADNGLSNLRGTIAMARTNDPNSATAQFYFNLTDNTQLDATAEQAGYAVFGNVTSGLDVIDTIAAVETEDRDDFTDVPVEDVSILDVVITERFTGESEITPAGEEYLASVVYESKTLIRDLLVQILGYSFIRF